MDGIVKRWLWDEATPPSQSQELRDARGEKKRRATLPLRKSKGPPCPLSPPPCTQTHLAIPSSTCQELVSARCGREAQAGDGVAAASVDLDLRHVDGSSHLLLASLGKAASSKAAQSSLRGTKTTKARCGRCCWCAKAPKARGSLLCLGRAEAAEARSRLLRLRGPKGAKCRRRCRCRCGCTKATKESHQECWCCAGGGDASDGPACAAPRRSVGRLPFLVGDQRHRV